MKNSETPVL